MGERPVRVCDLCGQSDDHPRHVVAHGPGGAGPPDQLLIRQVIAARGVSDEVKAQAVADLADTTLRQAHLDCCAEAGCLDRSCDAVHVSYPGPTKTGQTLTKYLTSGEVDRLGTALNAARAREATK